MRELEEVIGRERAVGPAAVLGGDALTSSLPSSLQMVHRYLIHVAAKAERLHERASTAKEEYRRRRGVSSGLSRGAEGGSMRGDAFLLGESAKRYFVS